ncbi:hypothetical protein SDC9_66569 [bioreactor metagenome]|uniref:Uncharacterized protein n=1 Tax=bioreactor metagenome TaxID=1076179 RepID=A0A644XV99_9ZZZZ
MAGTQRLLRTLAFNGHGHLRRNKAQYLFISFAIPDAGRIGLGAHHANDLALNFEWYPNPIYRGCPNGDHFSIFHQLFKGFGVHQSGLACTQHVFCKTFATFERFWLRIVFIYKIRKADLIQLRIVERDKEILHRHQVLQHIMDGFIQHLKII